MDRWVYSDVPREVKGDADALVCVDDRSVYFTRDEICCCQIKHLKELFESAQQREDAFSRGEKSLRMPCVVDDFNFMSKIAGLKPRMWKKIGEGDNDYECTLKEGVTKENFAECCKAYNRSKGLHCEFDEVKDETNKGEKIREYEYLLPKDKLRKVIDDNKILQPDLGSCEAGFTALRQYWELLSPEDQKLDVDSLVYHFDEDLKHLGYEMFGTPMD